jgi:hypothetical protein
MVCYNCQDEGHMSREYSNQALQAFYIKEDAIKYHGI